MRYTPVRVHAHGVHVCEVQAHKVYTREVHAHEVDASGPNRPYNPGLGLAPS